MALWLWANLQRKAFTPRDKVLQSQLVSVQVGKDLDVGVVSSDSSENSPSYANSSFLIYSPFSPHSELVWTILTLQVTIPEID